MRKRKEKTQATVEATLKVFLLLNEQDETNHIWSAKSHTGDMKMAWLIAEKAFDYQFQLLILTQTRRSIN